MATEAREPLLDDPRPPLWLWFNPQGRIDRRTWWRYGVLAMLGLAALLQALLEIARVPPDQAGEWVGLALAWPFAALSAKRWHDRDRSAWWLLVALVPVLGMLWLLVDNGFVRGTRGPNRFGPEPASDD